MYMGEINTEDSWAERSLRKLVEGFSLFTAGSFVISGFFNALVFWSRFRMNYFDIAQPSDIVMSGFLYVSMVLALTAAAILLVYANRFATRSAGPWIIDRLLRQIEIKNIVTARKFRKQFSNAELFRNVFKWVNLATALLTIATAIISVLIAPKHSKAFGPPPPSPFWERPLSAVGVSNLYLSNSDGQFIACGHAPVLWMGSASVVLNCHGRLRLVQNTQGLILERLSPAELKEISLAAPSLDLSRKPNLRTSSGLDAASENRVAIP